MPAHRRSHQVDASRRIRHGLITLDSSDWRRPVIRPGRVSSSPLSPPNPVHPAPRTWSTT